LSRGISTVIFFKLWTRAPTTRILLDDMQIPQERMEYGLRIILF
jgi:hypothetical protein